MIPTRTDVLVVGAGPVGLTTTIVLTMRGVDVTLVDRQPEGANTSRAAVVHARTLEVLDAVGVADTLVGEGIRASRFTIRDRDRILLPVRFDDLPTRYPYALMVPQAVTEGVLLERLHALGGEVLRPCTLTGMTTTEAAVTAGFDDGSSMNARYAVGADGMHSTVRELAGIGFGTGEGSGESFALADVRLDSPLPRDEVVLFFSRPGMLVWAPLPDGSVRLVAAVDDPPATPDVPYVQALLDTRGPTQQGSRVAEVVWGSRFRIHHRVADSFRAGPVLLAGDAGHVHSPAGGQGMNLGLQDAVAVGEAIADALRHGSEPALDRYAAERRPVAQEVVRFASRLTRLATAPPAQRRMRNTALRTLAQVPAFRRRMAWRLSGLVYR